MRFSACALLLAALNLARGAEFNAQDTPSVERQHVSALRQMISTVNAGDAAGYARLYATSATITIYGGETISGRDAIEKYEAALMREFPGTRLAFYEVWQAAPSAVVHYGVNGKTAGGAAMGHEGLLFFRFDRTGLIAEERRYLDAATPMAQLGAFGKVEMRSLPQLPDDLTAFAVTGPATNDRNQQTVRVIFQALEAGNTDLFMRNMASSAMVDDLMLPVPFKGPDVSRWLTAWSGAITEPKNIQITNTFSGNDYVIHETVMIGTLSGPIGRLSAGRKPFIVHAAWIAQFKDDKIVKLTRFLNSKELADATGQTLTPPRH